MAADCVCKAKRLLRLMTVLALLIFGGVAAQASGPVLTLPTSPTVVEDSSTDLDIGVTDSAVSIFTVTMTATSSNTNLISNSSLAFGGSGTNRLLSIRPKLHQYGATTITVIASDSQPATTTNTFTLTVDFTNYPPEFLTSIGDQTRNENAPSTNFSFSISDLETAVTALTVTATSSNTTLVPNANLVITGTGTNRVLHLTQATNENGTTLIELVVTDGGGATDTNDFLLTVRGVNQAPTFTLSTNRLTYVEDFGPVVLSNFVSNVSSGPPDQSSESNYFVLKYTTNFYAQAPALDTNGTLTFQVATNISGTNTIAFALFNSGSTTNGGKNSVTNTVTLDVPFVNQAPSFALSTNLLLVGEETLAVTNVGFLTNIVAGPSNEISQTWTFATTTTTNSATNAVFTLLPSLGTHGTLTFHPAAHSYGTNTVTVVMTDSGGTANGGVNAYTNSFQIGVVQTNHAPVIVVATNFNLLENAASGLTATVNVWDYDTQSTNLILVPTSLNTNIANISVTGTNVASATNAVFTVTFAPVTNANGTATIQLVASENGLATTNSLTLAVGAVNQAPSFALSTNLLLVGEETLAVTNVGFLTNIVAGPTNEISQTWTFATTTQTNSATNAVFTLLPSIGTHGNLTFHLAAHSYGTNTVTVVMTDSGGTNNGGINTYSNSFQIGVTQTNHAPVIVATNTINILENAISGLTATVNVWDYDPQSTNLILVPTSLNTNIATVSVTGTNVASATNAVFTLTFAPVTNANGSATIQLVASENGLATTNSLTLAVGAVNQAPSFTVSTNLLLVGEETLAVTNVGFLTNIVAGPTNEISQTWTFAATTVTNSATNAVFTQLPAIGTHGNLTFHLAAHSYGTNTVTVVMTDSGGTNNGGINTYSNSFQIGVTQTNHAPVIVATNTINILENAISGLTATVNVWDYDPQSTNLILVPTSLNTNIAKVSVTGTNVASATNAVFTLTFAPVTNANGSATIQLVASEYGLATTNSLTLAVGAVNQAPSYSLTTNVLAVLENAGTTVSNHFLTNLVAGPTNEISQTWTFTVFCPTNAVTNATFAQFPTVGTNGGITFKTATNSFGTNTVTVVMTDSGGTNNGGINTYSNTFQLQVIQVPYPPVFTGITNKTILENATTNLGLAFTLYDPLTTNFTVTCVSSNTNLVTVSLTGVGNARTLVFAPVTNANGSAVVSVTADDGSLTNTTNLSVTIVPVNQAPSFNLAMTSVTVDKFDVAVSIPNALTNILAGPTNESSQTVTFTVTNSSPSSFLVPPSVSSNGTLAFTPGATGGTITVGIKAVDNGGTSNGGTNASQVQTLTITIPANPFPYLTGPFAGLFYDTNAVANASSGYFNLNLTTNGSFTGYILCAGDSNTFNGQFSISNAFSSVNAGNYALDLSIDTSASWTETVSGSVSNTVQGWNVSLQSYLLGFSTTFPTPLAGEYLMALPGLDDPTEGPAGNSTLSLVISNNGVASLSGFMADNTSAKQTSQISLGGYYPLYVPLYSHGTEGSLVGWLNFTGALSNSVSPSSTLTWFNEAGATALYPAGFTNQSVPLAALYDSTLGDLLSFSGASVILSGGNLTTPITNAVTISGNVITVDPAATNGLNLTINRSTGEVLGTFVGANHTTNSIFSVILQDTTNVVDGYFLGTSQGGSFTLFGN